jgi:predicted Zn-dependent protease
VGYLARRLLGPLLTRKLIRNSEFEADQLSLQYQSASGYDPHEFSRLFKNAFQDQGKAPSFVDRMLNTHPLTSTRIKRLDKVRDRLPPETMNQPVDASRFLHAKERLAALLKVAVRAHLPRTHTHKVILCAADLTILPVAVAGFRKQSDTRWQNGRFQL